MLALESVGSAYEKAERKHWPQYREADTLLRQSFFLVNVFAIYGGVDKPYRTLYTPRVAAMM